MKNKGFTLIELMAVIGILATLIGLATINLSGAQQKSSISATVNVIISDMKEQQVKAMIGDTEGRASTTPYGVHVDASQYVLFSGTYSAAEPSNFVVPLPDTIKFDVASRPEIIFERVTGEVYQFSSGPDKIILKNTTNVDTKTIIFNRYGVIIDIN